MKKIRNYFVLMMVALFSVTAITSCNDDDDDDPDSPASKSEIIGTWKAVHEKFICKHDGKIVEQYDEAYDGTLLYEFTPGGTLIITEGGDVYTAIYKLSGNKLTIMDEDPDYQDELVVLNVKKLNGKVLELEETDKYQDDGFLHEDYSCVTFNKIK